MWWLGQGGGREVVMSAAMRLASPPRPAGLCDAGRGSTGSRECEAAMWLVALVAMAVMEGLWVGLLMLCQAPVSGYADLVPCALLLPVLLLCSPHLLRCHCGLCVAVDAAVGRAARAVDAAAGAAEADAAGA